MTSSITLQLKRTKNNQRKKSEKEKGQKARAAHTPAQPARKCMLMRMTQRPRRTGCLVVSATHGTMRVVERIMASMMKMVTSAKIVFKEKSK